MTMRIKIWHLITAICFSLLVLKVNLVIKIFSLQLVFFHVLVTDYSKAIYQIDFSLIDYFFSAIMIIIIPVGVIFLRRRIKVFSLSLNFTSAIIIILAAFFVFAPLVANNNPDFQQNIGETKLLPPLSSVEVIHLKREVKPAQNLLDKLVKLKEEVIKNTYDESIIFSDSLSISSNATIFQKNSRIILPKDTILYYDGLPVITRKYFLLGTDEFGRDIYSRLIYGARISLFVGLGSVIISLLLGVSLGFLAGYPGGFIDIIISRVTDMFLSFPAIFFVILILALFGNSLFTVILVLGFSGWMSLFKIVRGEVISLKQKDFFISAKMAGLSNYNLLTKEILPIILAPVVVNLVFQYGSVILAEAALSFLGLGTGSFYPSWGAMIEAGQNYLTQAWWMVVSPGLCLFITLFTANNLGREIQLYYNPRLKG
ncbi:MAG TPA: ABC transporter permease [Ignavibacteriaceae bacterium]|nr:ABC transporter permease [Ignavibacteriaceae bacterium]